MRYIRLPSFLADWKVLPESERMLVNRWLAEVFLPAVAAYDADPAGFMWPSGLRFERLQGTNGICAVTWSFSGPDGRATFEFSTVEGESYLVWRRIGHHAIYRQP